jgi:hypothetical protein
LSGYAQQRDIGGRIRAYELGFDASIVADRDPDPLRVADHVIVGKHKPALWFDDHA